MHLSRLNLSGFRNLDCEVSFRPGFAVLTGENNAGMLEAEKRFYRAQGYRDIPGLKAAIRSCLREVIGLQEEAAEYVVQSVEGRPKIHDGRDILELHGRNHVA